MRPRRLKHGTQVDSGQMYCVYRNQAAAAYLSLYFFSFFSLQFSNIENFVALFSETVRPIKLILMRTMGGCIVYTTIRLLFLICHLISFSPVFKN